jgi:hypothetical protein
MGACEANYYDSTITNHAGTPVSYVYDGRADTLPNGASKTYSVTLAAHSPSIDYSQFSHPKSVKMTNQGFYYEFVEVTPISLWVINNYGKGVSLSSEYLSEDNLSIIKDYNADTGKSIYTDKPVFTVEPNDFTHTPFVTFKVENGKMTVTIQ